jgi:membrane protease subunit HflC
MSGKILFVLLLIAGIIVSMSIFTVDERETAIKLQLGEVLEADYQPGLYFKLPLIQDILKFDKRIQNLDSDPELYLTLYRNHGQAAIIGQGPGGSTGYRNHRRANQADRSS